MHFECLPYSFSGFNVTFFSCTHATFFSFFDDVQQPFFFFTMLKSLEAFRSAQSQWWTLGPPHREREASAPVPLLLVNV